MKKAIKLRSWPKPVAALQIACFMPFALQWYCWPRARSGPTKPRLPATGGEKNKQKPKVLAPWLWLMHARAVVNHLPAILFDQSTERTSGPKTYRQHGQQNPARGSDIAQSLWKCHACAVGMRVIALRMCEEAKRMCQLYNLVGDAFGFTI